MKPLAAVLFLLILAAPAAAEIYKWRDENGRLHFSDRPMHRDAQPIEVTPNDAIQSTPSQRPAASSTAPKTLPRAQANRQSSGQTVKDPRAITYSDYSVNAAAHYANDTVTVKGRVTSGPACKNLQLKFFLRDNFNKTLSATGTIEYPGHGSRIFDFPVKIPYSGYGEAWLITSRYADCY